MDRETLAATLEHTVLGPETTAADAERVVREAAARGTGACVPPCFLDAARAADPDVRLATVVGFPHGQHDPEVKAVEAERAERAGADEVDAVCNLGHLLAGETTAFGADVAAVVAATSRPVKLIVQAPRLSAADLRRACELAVDAGADYLKTATGFGLGGATVADASLMAEYAPVKAAGGVRDAETARALLDAGAERIGTSTAVELLADA